MLAARTQRLMAVYGHGLATKAIGKATKATMPTGSSNILSVIQLQRIISSMGTYVSRNTKKLKTEKIRSMRNSKTKVLRMKLTMKLHISAMKFNANMTFKV